MKVTELLKITIYSLITIAIAYIILIYSWAINKMHKNKNKGYENGKDTIDENQRKIRGTISGSERSIRTGRTEGQSGEKH